MLPRFGICVESTELRSEDRKLLERKLEPGTTLIIKHQSFNENKISIYNDEKCEYEKTLFLCKDDNCIEEINDRLFMYINAIPDKTNRVKLVQDDVKVASLMKVSIGDRVHTWVHSNSNSKSPYLEECVVKESKKVCSTTEPRRLGICFHLAPVDTAKDLLQVTADRIYFLGDKSTDSLKISHVDINENATGNESKGSANILMTEDDLDDFENNEMSRKKPTNNSQHRNGRNRDDENESSKDLSAILLESGTWPDGLLYEFNNSNGSNSGATKKQPLYNNKENNLAPSNSKDTGRRNNQRNRWSSESNNTPETSNHQNNKHSYSGPRDALLNKNTTVDVPLKMDHIEGTDLEDGLLVVVNLDEGGTATATGTIRWMGKPYSRQKEIFVGVELDEPVPEYIDKAIVQLDLKLFPCEPKYAIYVSPTCCFKNPDYSDEPSPITAFNLSEYTRGDIPESSCVKETTAPREIYEFAQLQDICGPFKGIQGDHNSCYLDATLFAMFAFTYVFDHVLYRPKGRQDLPFYDEIQSILRDEIVHPLRKNGFVRSEPVTKLRQILNRVSDEGGYTTDEKDPEEFFNSIYNHIFKAEPLLQLSTGAGIYFYQLFVDKDERIGIPTVQQLFHQSLSSADIKLKESPSCLIIQMPRFGRSFKMYDKIIPSIHLDITDALENSPRICHICERLAVLECKDCFESNFALNLVESGFCEKCYYNQHMGTMRSNHKKPKPISTPREFHQMAKPPLVRHIMDLFAVICIETSHYVAFVKTASEADAPWCFFDSMADRHGEADGFNIPELFAEGNLSNLMVEGELLNDLDKISIRANRLLSDAYICMYRDSTASMYK